MLLERLIAKQTELGVSDSEFARILEIPRSTWQLTRTRVKPVMWRVVVAAVRRFPEMAEDATLFLRSDAMHVARRATGANSPLGS